MSPLEILRLCLVVVHLVGLAAIIGPFILQLPRREGFLFSPMLVGSIVQLASGIALIAVRKTADLAVIDEKMLVKLIITLAVLASVIVGIVRQKRLRAAGRSDAPVRVFMITAGVLAIVNVVIAVFWQ